MLSLTSTQRPRKGEGKERMIETQVKEVLFKITGYYLF